MLIFEPERRAKEKKGGNALEIFKNSESESLNVGCQNTDPNLVFPKVFEPHRIFNPPPYGVLPPPPISSEIYIRLRGVGMQPSGVLKPHGDKRFQGFSHLR